MIMIQVSVNVKCSGIANVCKMFLALKHNVFIWQIQLQWYSCLFIGIFFIRFVNLIWVQTFTRIPVSSNKIFWYRNKKYDVIVFVPQHKPNLVTVCSTISLVLQKYYCFILFVFLFFSLNIELVIWRRLLSSNITLLNPNGLLYISAKNIFESL